MRLAFAEIRRAKLRFFLLTGAVGLLAYLILFQQSLAGSLLGQFTGGLEHQSANVIVYGEDARRSVDGSRVTPEQVEAVAAVEGVGAAGPVGQTSFTVEPSGTGDAAQVDASIFGFELGGPGAPTTLSEGRLPEADGEAVASAGDAEGFALGDTVTVVPGDTPLEIVGIAEDASFNVQPTLFVSYPTYEGLVRTTNPEAPVVLPSYVGVETAAGVDPVALAARITEEVPGTDAVDRDTAVASLPGVSSIEQSFSIILGLAFIVVVLLIGFFFLIITVQKLVPLTLLRAVGASGGFLLRNLALQVVLVVGLGLLLALGLLAASAAALSEQAVGVSFEPATVATTLLAILVLALLAALAAMRRVSRIDPMAATSRAGGGGLA